MNETHACIQRHMDNGEKAKEIIKKTGYSKTTVYKYMQMIKGSLLNSIDDKTKSLLLENLHAPLADLAKQLGVSVTTVSDYYKAIGVSKASIIIAKAKKVVYLWKENVSMVDIGKEVGLSRERVRQIIQEHNDKFVVDDNVEHAVPIIIQKAQELEKQGYSDKIIAFRLGLSEQVVRQIRIVKQPEQGFYENSA